MERVALNALSAFFIFADELLLPYGVDQTHDYPDRLHHKTPGWVSTGALFHIRIRAAAEQTPAFTDPILASHLLAEVRRFHVLGYWWCHLFLIMPDHIHSMLAFYHDLEMSETIRNWKRGTARIQGVHWQNNYFDHRIRNDAERNKKWTYIRRNPVVKGLCVAEDAWPHWWSAVTAWKTR